MARQVFYDPFGQRMNGYRAGIQDETNLQDQTRRARASDFDYNNIAPIRLEQLQRTNALEQFADPFMRNQYGIQQRANLAGLANTELGVNSIIGQSTGNYSPYLATALNYGSGRSVGSEQFLPAQVRAYGDMTAGQTPDMAAIAAQFGIDPQIFQQALQMLTGTVSPAVEQGIDQFYGFDRARALAGDNRQLNMDDWTQQVQGQNAQVDAQNANTQQMNILGMLQRWQQQQGDAQAPGAVDEDGF